MKVSIQPGLQITQFLVKALAWTQPKAEVVEGSQQGFTLIESLVAVIMIGIAISATMPPLFVATATRVQNRRVEQAMQLGQGEIDRVRTIVEQNSGYAQPHLLPKAVTGVDDAKDYKAATSIASDYLISPNPADKCHQPPTALLDNLQPEGPSNPKLQVFAGADELIPVDIDGQVNATTGACDAEFLMQVFRVDNGTAEIGSFFEVGVRVYAISAVSNINALQTNEASLKFTTATGAQMSRPLTTIYTNITKADRNDGSLCPFHDLAGC